MGCGARSARLHCVCSGPAASNLQPPSGQSPGTHWHTKQQRTLGVAAAGEAAAFLGVAAAFLGVAAAFFLGAACVYVSVCVCLLCVWCALHAAAAFLGAAAFLAWGWPRCSVSACA